MIGLVIVPKQMKKAVERQHPQLRQLGVSRRPRLPSGDAPGYHDLA